MKIQTNDALQREEISRICFSDYKALHSIKVVQLDFSKYKEWNKQAFIKHFCSLTKKHIVSESRDPEVIRTINLVAININKPINQLILRLE